MTSLSVTGPLTMLWACLLLTNPGATDGVAGEGAKPKPAGEAAKPPAEPGQGQTYAERITNTRESITQAERAIAKMQARLDDPMGEFEQAKMEFETINNKLKMVKDEIARLTEDKQTEAAAVLQAKLPELEQDWQLARDRFDISIRQRKATQESIIGLKERIAADQQRLDRLEGREPAKTKPAPSAPSSAPGAGSTPSPSPVTSAAPAKAPAGAEAKSTASTPPAAASPTPAPAVELLGSSLGVPADVLAPPDPVATPAHTVTTFVPPTAELAKDPALRRAHEHLIDARQRLADEEAATRLAEERVQTMKRSIRNAETMRTIEQDSVAQAEKAMARLKTTLQNSKGDPQVDQLTRQRLTETERRLLDTRRRVEQFGMILGNLGITLKEYEEELARHVQAQEEATRAVEEAEAEIQAILSPFSTQNMWRWSLDRGPRMILIIVSMLLLHLLVSRFSVMIVKLVTRGNQRGSPEDRENRANTLVGVFRYATGLAIYGGGVVMLLEATGVPIIPLMGGAAVVGLAIAFGAQNLIRDYFTGFMMLLEDQYSVNDVVRIGQIAGLVEHISLRMTVLRDLEGVRHFLPHGTITSVSNLTHGWSRAMLDVPVAYKENVDRVMAVLIELGQEMRNDPVLGRQIINDPEMLGVDSLGNSGVVIKLLLKTRPLQQWPVKREMLRRIKNRFDELGIEIPFPHRTVYHRFPEGIGEVRLGSADDDREAA